MNRPKIIEYEPEIVTTHGTFKESEVKERIGYINDRIKREIAEGNERQRQQENAKTCPFRSSANNMKILVCGEDCGFYIGNGCALVALADGAPEIPNTEGRKCPLATIKCNKDCALFENGCAVTRIAAQKKENKNEPI